MDWRRTQIPRVNAAIPFFVIDAPGARRPCMDRWPSQGRNKPAAAGIVDFGLGLGLGALAGNCHVLRVARL